MYIERSSFEFEPVSAPITFVTMTPPGASRLARELEELARGEVERDRVRVERVDHDHVPALVVPRQPAPAVVDVDAEPRDRAAARTSGTRDFDHLGVELDDLQLDAREVAPDPLRRRAAAEADEEDRRAVGR